MSESYQRRTVLRALKPLHAVAVENRVPPYGMPDVNFAGGWMELKWLPRWPTRPDTVVLVPHFTKVQRKWLRTRPRYGEPTWLMLQVRRDWLLFEGPTAAEILGSATRAQLMAAAVRTWNRGLNGEELRQCLPRRVISGS